MQRRWTSCLLRWRTCATPTGPAWRPARSGCARCRRNTRTCWGGWKGGQGPWAGRDLGWGKRVAGCADAAACLPLARRLATLSRHPLQSPSPLRPPACLQPLRAGQCDAAPRLERRAGKDPQPQAAPPGGCSQEVQFVWFCFPPTEVTKHKAAPAGGCWARAPSGGPAPGCCRGGASWVLGTAEKMEPRAAASCGQVGAALARQALLRIRATLPPPRSLSSSRSAAAPPPSRRSCSRRRARCWRCCRLEGGGRTGPRAGCSQHLSTLL